MILICKLANYIFIHFKTYISVLNDLMFMIFIEKNLMGFHNLIYKGNITITLVTGCWRDMAIYFYLSMVPIIQVSCRGMVIVVKGVVMADFHIDLCFRSLYRVCIVHCIVYIINLKTHFILYLIVDFFLRMLHYCNECNRLQ